MTALRDALDNDASTDDIKSKLTAFRNYRDAKQEALKKAQAGLQEVLTVKQEAQCVLMGLLE